MLFPVSKKVQKGHIVKKKQTRINFKELTIFDQIILTCFKGRRFSRSKYRWCRSSTEEIPKLPECNIPLKPHDGWWHHIYHSSQALPRGRRPGGSISGWGRTGVTTGGPSWDPCRTKPRLVIYTWHLHPLPDSQGLEEICIDVLGSQGISPPRHAKMFGQGECISRYYITSNGEQEAKTSHLLASAQRKADRLPYGFNIGTFTNTIQLKPWNTDVFSSPVPQIKISSQPRVFLRGARAVMSQ